MNSPFESTPHICKCGSKKFFLIAELHFDNKGTFSPKEGWQFQCINCNILYDLNGIEVND